MKHVFMGTPAFAVPSLEKLANAGHEILAVYTQPDRPKGRGQKDTQSPVKEAALRLGLVVHQPERIRKPEPVEQLRLLVPECIIVVGYGQLIPKSILEIPSHGIINLHASLLPKYRGAAPIQWAIANGDTETGVTIMKMDAGMDTGEILTQRATPIAAEDNGATLQDRLAQMGAELLARTIPEFVAGKIQPRPQDNALATHAPKIKKEDGQIDWRQPATTIWNRLRAFTPWPGAFTFMFGVPPSGGTTSSPAPPEGGTPNASPSHLLKIWEAQTTDMHGEPGKILIAGKSGIIVGCGEGALKILLLQREGGRRMSAGEFLAGHQLPLGQRLG